MCDLLDHPNDTEMEAYYENEEFSGFYAAIKEKDILCILYFSIEENKRDHGIGSQILNNIINNHPDCRIIVDVELPEDYADNETQRLSRMHFYHKNGFKDTDIIYKWKNTDYQILIYNGKITYNEYQSFWHSLDKKRQKDMD